MLIEYMNIFWSDFCQKRLNIDQILVRILGKIGLIVGQILENFSQILTISTLRLAIFRTIYKIATNAGLQNIERPIK